MFVVYATKIKDTAGQSVGFCGQQSALIVSWVSPKWINIQLFLKFNPFVTTQSQPQTQTKY